MTKLAFYAIKMFSSNYDNTEGTDSLNNKFLDILVLNPRTHIKNGKAIYTDYEVVVKTDDPAFALQESHVRRRFSEFVWMKNRILINDVMMVTAPSLPRKCLFGKFKEEFIQRRQKGLQNFLNKLIEVNAFLSEPALHLLLQTTLPISEMDRQLNRASHPSNIRDIILASNDAQVRRQKKSNVSLTSHVVDVKRKRSVSVDSIPYLGTSGGCTPQEKRKQVPSTGFAGRGWSRYIGDGYHVFSPLPVVDQPFSEADQDNGLSFRPRSLTATACVLPGGQLRLPTPINNTRNPSTSKSKKFLSSSWHGSPNDIIDILLDDYDVVQTVDLDETPSCDMESMTTSDTSPFYHSNEIDDDMESSDDGIEVDINEKLKCYEIIPLPRYSFYMKSPPR